MESYRDFARVYDEFMDQTPYDEWLLNILNIFKEYKEDAKIYLAKINTETYVSKSKNAYENELEENEIYNTELQEASRKGKDITNIINKKMESDKRLSLYQSSLIQASNFFSKYPNGLTVGGLLAIKYQDGLNLIIEGFNQKYRSFNPNYLLKWEVIKELNKNGYKYFNLNGRPTYHGSDTGDYGGNDGSSSYSGCGCSYCSAEEGGFGFSVGMMIRGRNDMG